jgi:hypothetical protein
MTGNYWIELADRVRAGEAEATQELPRELERYLRIMVRRSLKAPAATSNVARAARSAARALDDAGSAVVDQVAQALTRVATERLQALPPARPLAAETVLA